MITGYTRPLYLLPFDHRASYISGLFGWKEPLNVEQMVTVANSKHVIYAGFQQAIANHVPKDRVGILVDEEFGSAILRDAVSKGYITVVSVEKSGQEEFEFAYGEDFAQHIEAFHPTFAKVLVRYNPEEDAALNQRQAGRLKRLSDYLHQAETLFMFELLVPATPMQLEQVEGDTNAYDLHLRPRLMLIDRARESGRTLLTEVESKQLLGVYGIPTVETRVATNETEALTHAEAIGYPVVLKLFSETITHKTDVGGVQLDLDGADAVCHAYQAIEAAVREKVGAEHFLGVTVQPMIPLDGYELILGSSLDPQFGPVLLFGSGGQLVEVYQDRALALPPLTMTLARRMMEQTRIFTALKGVRGRPPVDLTALEHLLVRFSYLVTEQRWIQEIDINPLLASPERLLALDARVVLHGPDISEEMLSRLAIRPYPTQYVQPWTLRNGTPVTLRPIRPENEPLMVTFHETLSARRVYLRWLHMLNLSRRTAHEEMIRICFIDYDREMALVADYDNPQTGQHETIGVGRLIKEQGTKSAEVALLVTDQLQRQGLGTELLRQLIQVGRDERLQRLTGDTLIENQGMVEICKKLGFRLQYSLEEQVVKVELAL